MDSFDVTHLIYLALLLMMLVGLYLASGRQSLGKMAQQALTWVLIFVGVLAAVGLWDDIRQTVRPWQSVSQETGQIILPRAPDGHYYLEAEVNGVAVRFVIDTGASQIVLSQQDAETVGIDTASLAYVGRANTANGPVQIAPVRLDELSVDGISDTDVRAVVNGGELHKSLLGMTYLQRFERVEIRGNELVLTR